MKYVKLYDTHTEHEVDKSDLMKLDYACTYCKDNKDSWLWYKRDIYADQYLTFESLEDGNTFKFSKSGLSYSVDDGDTWINLNADTSTSVINLGKTIMFKGNMEPYQGDTYGMIPGIGNFSSSFTFNALGNPLSLIYGDNFEGQKDITGKNKCFSSLFKNSKVLSAEHLSLPATTLANYCYSSMFESCSLLTIVPKLPATTLTPYCYYAMFQDCDSLTVPPELPATTLADHCYYFMFFRCHNLLELPVLPATTLAGSCYATMFSYCSSIETIPENYLPVTTLADRCYFNMFSHCTSLTTAPELPATTLAQSCYYGMFNNCTSLTTAPELPGTTLANNCYYEMFRGCTSLMTAPELPATTLANNCYYRMFQGCSNLYYIKAMFTTEPSTTYTQSWVYGVSSTGTFIKNSAASWNVTGANGIPEGWTVQYADS